MADSTKATEAAPSKRTAPVECARGQKEAALALRREKILLRSGLSREERKRGSGRIMERLISQRIWKSAKTVLIYVSYGAEVSTEALIDRALLEGKAVFCPKVCGTEMEFYRIFSRADLKPGFHGIPEPEGGTQYRRQPGKTGADVLLIAPGTVFDRKGNRIGYGGGYYDRYLGRFSKEDMPYCIGLCFFCQLAARIEPRAHDAAMDMVIWDS